MRWYTVGLCSVLRSWSHLRLYFVTGFYMTWLTWAHNSMLINYDSIWSSCCSCCHPLTPERKDKLRQARSSKQCCSAIQVFYVHITLSSSRNMRTSLRAVSSPRPWGSSTQCLDTTNTFSFTCITPVAPITPVCAVTQQKDPPLHLNLEEV